MKKYTLLIAVVVALLTSLILLPLFTTAQAARKKPRKAEVKQADEAKAEQALKVFWLKNASAPALTESLLPLFKEGAEPRLVIVCDPRTNSIIARGSDEEVKILQALLIQLDADTAK